MLFWLPNSITLLALFFGFQCVVAATQGEYVQAIYLMFFAMIADFLDGRVARLLKAESEFGTSFDSISDTIAFALAPALLIHQWILITLTNYGFKPFLSWAIAFSYLASGAFRLARFNVVTVVDKRFFQGLPSPIAALTIASFVGLAIDHQWPKEHLIIPAIALTLGLGYLMVSKFPFYSFKTINLTNRVAFGSYVFLIIIALVTLQIIYEYALFDFLAIISTLYVTHPLVGYCRRWFKR